MKTMYFNVKLYFERRRKSWGWEWQGGRRDADKRVPARTPLPKR